MKQHKEKAGKKRRYQVFKALEMKENLNKKRLTIAILIAVGVSATMLPFIIPIESILPTGGTTIMSILTAITFIALMLVSMKMYKYFEDKRSYTEYCLKANITKADEKALKEGLL